MLYADWRPLTPSHFTVSLVGIRLHVLMPLVDLLNARLINWR